MSSGNDGQQMTEEQLADELLKLKVNSKYNGLHCQSRPMFNSNIGLQMHLHNR